MNTKNKNFTLSISFKFNKDSLICVISTNLDSLYGDIIGVIDLLLIFILFSLVFAN